MTKVVVAGAGSIGSLLAGHLARVAEVTVLTRREEHATALRENGLRVSGRSDFTAQLAATADPFRLPEDADLAILACKGTDLEPLAATLEGRLPRATWIGPFRNTDEADAQRVAELIVAGGLKAEAFADLRPLQWSKLIFNATVNGVAALTGLPHDFHFAQTEHLSDLGHLVRDLVDEGRAVATAAGVQLHDDPWEMNVLATQHGSRHFPSMLEDVEARRPTEVESINGALVREARRRGVPVPLQDALYRLVKAKEASYSE